MIKPDDLKTIRDKGLPFHKQPYKFGNLFVSFKVEFPERLPVPALVGIRTALGQPAKDDADMESAENVMLQDFDESQRNTKAAGGTQDDSDEEEEGRGGDGPRVQCAQ